MGGQAQGSDKLGQASLIGKKADTPGGKAYLIARLNSTGQFDGLLERLGGDADVRLVVFGAVMICTRVLVQVWGCKTKAGHRREHDVGLRQNVATSCLIVSRS